MPIEIDCRFQGLPNSTVEREDHTRQELVQKLIHQFKTHPNREALKADVRQNHAYSPSSEKSKDMIHSMVNVEYFEMCQISPQIQCPNCLTYWTTGILCCTCGNCLYLTDKTRKLNGDRIDTLSLPQYVVKKGPTHVARHGNTERQRIYHVAHTAVQKAKKRI